MSHLFTGLIVLFIAAIVIASELAGARITRGVLAKLNDPISTKRAVAARLLPLGLLGAVTAALLSRGASMEMVRLAASAGVVLIALAYRAAGLRWISIAVAYFVDMITRACFWLPVVAFGAADASIIGLAFSCTGLLVYWLTIRSGDPREEPKQMWAT